MESDLLEAVKANGRLEHLKIIDGGHAEDEFMIKIAYWSKRSTG